MREHELEIIIDITTGGPKPKVLVKNDRIKKIFDLDNIELEEYVDRLGKHIKKYSSVYENNIHYKVNKPYEELKKLKLNRSIAIVGLAGKSKKYK